MPDFNAPEPSEDPLFSANHEDALDQHQLNVEQMLSLVDSILPFEACLFHQVTPLSIEARTLHLGMVDPQDRVALNYVRRQVSHIHYSVVPWPVAADWHRQTLSQYLSDAAKAKQPTKNADPGQTSVGPKAPDNDTATLVVDSPSELPKPTSSPSLTVPRTISNGAPTPGPNPAPISISIANSAPPSPLQLDLSWDGTL